LQRFWPFRNATMTIFPRKISFDSLQGKFLSVMSSIILCSTIVTSTVIAVQGRKLLHDSLIARGQSFASYIAKLSKEPLVMRDSILLDAIVNDANKAEDVVYAVIRDPQGRYLTSHSMPVSATGRRD